MTDGVLNDLTVADGSCRDINLFGVMRAGAERLLMWIRSQFDSHVGDAHPSCDEVQPIEGSNFASPLDAGFIVHGVLERGSRLFDQLQYFVVPAVDGDWFVELTFFPEDLHLDGRVAPFTVWLETARVTAAASGALVRFENASFYPAWERRGDRQVILFVPDGER